MHAALHLCPSLASHSAASRQRRDPNSAAAAATHCAATQRRSGACGGAGRPPSQRCAATDFHQSLLAATERGAAASAPPLAGLEVREAEGDEELRAASWLRALSFYRYPAERKFAAQVHRVMVAEEEFKDLKAAALARRLGTVAANERSACLVALCPAAQLAGDVGEDGELGLDDGLLLGGGGGGDGRHAAGGAPAGFWEQQAAAAVQPADELAVVGSLDLYAVRALQGEVLIGDSRNAAYLANVCTAAAARRRRVGQALLAAARQLARGWGVDALYVHTMAVNEIAVRFYERNGFAVEKEESSNAAHYRGRCLDGIEGRGRTVLMRDTRLYD